MGLRSLPSHSRILCSGPLGLTWWAVVSLPSLCPIWYITGIHPNPSHAEHTLLSCHGAVPASHDGEWCAQHDPLLRSSHTCHSSHLCTILQMSWPRLKHPLTLLFFMNQLYALVSWCCSAPTPHTIFHPFLRLPATLDVYEVSTCTIPESLLPEGCWSTGSPI
jgi:hypothetical protein